MTRRSLWNTAVLLLLVIGCAWVWLNRVPGEQAAVASDLPPAPAIGHPAPDFSLSAVDGRRVSLSELRGKPVILNFWATWCPPCRAELPELEAASQRYRGQVAVVGVDQAEPADEVQAFVAQMGLTFPIPLDSKGQVSHAYAVRSLPTTFFIDRQGIIRQIQVGPLTEATLEQLLRMVYP